MRKGLLALVAVAVVVVPVGYAVRENVRDRQRCEVFEALAAEHGDRLVGTGTPTLLIVGDSYAEGMELEDPSSAWPASFADAAGVAAEVDAASGTGFTTQGPCGAGAFTDRVAGTLPLLIQGGLNDVGAEPQDITDALCAIADGRSVTVVGPPLAPARDKDEVERVDATLAAAAARCGATYISALGWNLPYTNGGLHLTADGHKQFGRMVAEQFIRAQAG